MENSSEYVPDPYFQEGGRYLAEVNKFTGCLRTSLFPELKSEYLVTSPNKEGLIVRNPKIRNLEKLVLWKDVPKILEGSPLPVITESHVPSNTGFVKVIKPGKIHGYYQIIQSIKAFRPYSNVIEENNLLKETSVLKRFATKDIFSSIELYNKKKYTNYQHYHVYFYTKKATLYRQTRFKRLIELWRTKNKEEYLKDSGEAVDDCLKEGCYLQGSAKFVSSFMYSKNTGMYLYKKEKIISSLLYYKTFLCGILYYEGDNSPHNFSHLKNERAYYKLVEEVGEELL